MTWIAESLWPILAVPLLTAGLIAARSAGAERRQKVAHGVSRGLRAPGTTSPGEGRKIILDIHFRPLGRTSFREASVAPAGAWFVLFG